MGLRFYPTWNLIGQSATVLWMRLLGQRQSTFLLTSSMSFMLASVFLAPKSHGAHRVAQMDAMHTVGSHHSWELSTLGNTNSLQWADANLLFALEGDIIFILLDNKQICSVPEADTQYRNTVNKIVHKKAMSASVHKMCRNMRDPEGIVSLQW